MADSMTPPPPRRGEVVLIVAGGELASRAIKHLSARFPGLVVLREEPETKWQIIRRRTRLLGPLSALSQVAKRLVLVVELPFPNRQVDDHRGQCRSQRSGQRGN